MIVKDGYHIFEPEKSIPTGQQWYWTEEWQDAEREAQEDIEARRTMRFDTVEELMQDLMKADEYTSSEGGLNFDKGQVKI